jgi:hypothetical protein
VSLSAARRRPQPNPRLLKLGSSASISLDDARAAARITPE